jgi:hypothetical protein
VNLGGGELSLYDRSYPCCQVEALMHYCVVVQTNGKQLDYLRGEAYRVSLDAKIDWYAEPRNLGTAFCFEGANVRTRFCAICARENITYATEHPSK